jgi:hypothetical protein
MKDQITAHHKPHLVAHMHTIDLENKKRKNADNCYGNDMTEKKVLTAAIKNTSAALCSYLSIIAGQTLCILHYIWVHYVH